jgi:uncharacterized protein
MRIIQFIFFLLTVLLVFSGMHFYVFYRLTAYLEIERTRLMYSGVWWLIALFFIATILEKTLSNPITRVFYCGATIWLGIIFFALFWFLVFELIRWFWPWSLVWAGRGLLILTLATALIAFINARQIHTRSIDIYLPKLSRPMTAVHLSDIHLGTIHGKKYMAKIAKKTNSLKPDMVFITGDLFDGSAPVDTVMLSPINQIEAPVWFTLGNHELYEGIPLVQKALQGIDLKLLRNEIDLWEGIQIAGIDHPSNERMNGIPELQKLRFDPSLPAILLYHPPSGFNDALAAGIDLQLSGHSHWGQIFPFNLLVKIAFPKGFGYQQHGALQIYTSPGTGTWGPPMRLGSRSEITFIRLFPENSHGN